MLLHPATASRRRSPPPIITQATNVVYPDSTSVTNVLTLRGEIVQTRGSRPYPTGYGYDDQARLQFMTNWSAFPNTNPRVTKWNYNSQRGWLDSKNYPNPSDNGSPTGPGPSYQYWLSGRLMTRTWARGVVTSYTY